MLKLTSYFLWSIKKTKPCNRYDWKFDSGILNYGSFQQQTWLDTTSAILYLIPNLVCRVGSQYGPILSPIYYHVTIVKYNSLNILIIYKGYASMGRIIRLARELLWQSRAISQQTVVGRILRCFLRSVPGTWILRHACPVVNAKATEPTDATKWSSKRDQPRSCKSWRNVQTGMTQKSTVKT